MNCLKCKNKGINVVGQNYCEQPYKYYCKKGKFVSYSSNSSFGTSLEHDNKTYYTEDQLRNFSSKRKICIDRLGMSSEAFFRLLFNFLALTISVFSLFVSFDNKNKNDKLSIQINEKKINELVIHKVDSFIKLKESTEKDELIRNNLNSAKGVPSSTVYKIPVAPAGAGLPTHAKQKIKNIEVKNN